MKRLADHEADLALEDFKKALVIQPDNGDCHFASAVCYSLLEHTKMGFYHLEYVSKKNRRYREDIINHPQLAYLRIQPEYDAFKKSYLR